MRGGGPVVSSSSSSTASDPASSSHDESAFSEGQWQVVKYLSLALIYIIAFVIRLFAVIRFESVIHEYDPYFNYRTTKYLVDEGFYKFYNWFDDASWYPLGRIIGGTVYPGLMMTAAAIYYVVEFLTFPLSVRNVCVFTAPFFASNTTIVAYLFGKEVKDEKTGLFAAFFIAIVPGYISRSVAGSYDNEGVAIFAMNLTFFLFVKAVNTGSLFWALNACMAYMYMVFAWGGYIFIINLIPLYVLYLIFTGRYSNRLYIAYSTFYVVGTILAMQVRFVNFQAVQSSEHLLALLTFVFIHAFNAYRWIQSLLRPESFAAVQRFFLQVIFGIILAIVAFVVFTGYTPPWTGRFYALLDPTYAKTSIPIIASVSEHQPTTWASFFFDLHILVFLVPAGLYLCFMEPSSSPRADASTFVMLYGITSVYFSGVMVRLMLVLAPIACLLAAIGLSTVLSNLISVLKYEELQQEIEPLTEKSKKKAPSTGFVLRPGHIRFFALIFVGFILILLLLYVRHSIWVTSEAYSSPSVVMAARSANGGRIMFDDFRESYYWLRQNTPPDAKVMSWWDYGYQITEMANRTILVDNNTWNNTHIATVGKAMSANEDKALEIMKSLDVDYILAICGAMTGYASDDINKFLWMVRIAGSVDPSVVETDYFSRNGEYRIDKEASPIMLDSLMYKMCFYRFGEVMTEYGKPSGWDRVRNVEIGRKNFELKHIEEAFTSEHWIVRIYKVKNAKNRS